LELVLEEVEALPMLMGVLAKIPMLTVLLILTSQYMEEGAVHEEAII
jgi:hypothetical protein